MQSAWKIGIQINKTVHFKKEKLINFNKKNFAKTQYPI